MTFIQNIKDEDIAKQIFEEEKVRILLNHAQGWKIANELKAFVDQVEKNDKDSKTHVNIQQWVKRGRIVVNKLDPIFCEADLFLDLYNYKSAKSLKREIS